MNLVDILIWLVMAGFVVKGFMKGLVRQVCSLLGFLLGGWAAIKYHHLLADVSGHVIKLPQYVAIILSFIVIFLGIGLVFYLFGHILTVMFKLVLLGGVNRVGGVLLGALEGAFIICMVLYFGSSSHAPAKLRDHVLKSSAAVPFIAAGREIVGGWSQLPVELGVVPGGKAGGAKK
jgi:membrane protein required for colicin V production